MSMHVPARRDPRRGMALMTLVVALAVLSVMMSATTFQIVVLAPTPGTAGIHTTGWTEYIHLPGYQLP